MNYFTLNICGLTRQLPLIYVGRKTQIASFSLLGDVELVEKTSESLARKLKGVVFDYLVGPEVKVVPLLHCLAEKLGQKNYVVCRKSVKAYMVSPVILKPLDYFPKHIKPLVIDGHDVNLIKGKNVVILDDVVSTGITIRMIKKLMENIGASVVKILVLVKQGEQFDQGEDFDFLVSIPIFKDQ